MRAFALSTSAFILMALGAGCGLRVNFTQASSPRYWAVENKTQAQLNQVQTAAQDKQIPYFLADGLAVNDDLIRRLNGRFRDTSNGATDISPDQYAFLTTLIEGNQQALSDILADPAEWEKSFAAQDAFARSDRKPAYHAFNDAAKRLRFIIYLNTRLKADAARAQALSDSGHISPDQSRDLQDNLNDVQNKALEDYEANGALDLTADQIFQLRRMLADAYEPLTRPQGPPAFLGGSFQPGTGFSGGGYTPPTGSYYGGGYQSVGQAYNPPPKTGHPAPTATPTPVPQNPGGLEGRRLHNYQPGPKHHGGSFQGEAPAPTDTPDPIPTDTPVPEPTDHHWGQDQGQHKDQGNHFGQDKNPASNGPGDRPGFDGQKSQDLNPTGSEAPSDTMEGGQVRPPEDLKAPKDKKNKGVSADDAPHGKNKKDHGDKKDEGDPGTASPTPED